MYDFDQQVKAALAQHGKALLLKDTDKAYQQYKAKQHTKLRFMYQAAAAAAVVVLAVSVWFMSPSTSFTSDQLFAQHYNRPATSAERGTPDTPLSWRNALLAYNEQDYTTAISLLQQSLRDPSFKQHDAGWYYIGQSYLAQKQLVPALDALKKVSQKSLLYPDAQWFMSLAALANHQEAQSIDILNTIAADNTHHKQDEARLLLKQLGK